MTTYKTDKVRHLAYWMGPIFLFLFCLCGLEAVLAQTMRFWRTTLAQKGKCWVPTQVDINYKIELLRAHLFTTSTSGPDLKLAAFRLNKQRQWKRTATESEYSCDWLCLESSKVKSKIFHSNSTWKTAIHTSKWLEEIHQVENIINSQCFKWCG